LQKPEQKDFEGYFLHTVLTFGYYIKHHFKGGQKKNQGLENLYDVNIL